MCVDAAIDASAAVNQFDEAASMLEEFVTRQPGHIPALLKLVEVCVDGGLEATMYDAQVQLADAYLSAGQGADARAIAEDLVAREPWEAGHIDRFRRALVMLRVSEPDTVIAERLSGQSPFTATDRFSAPPEPSAASDVKPALMVEVRPSEPPPYQAPAPGGPRTPPRSSPGSGEIDLSSALGDMGTSEAAPPASLADVFKGLRKDAGRADGADKSAQHMTLARTYLEMGMLEEATASLKTAAGSPRQRFEAASLLGRLYREHGDSAQAIEWLERAAEAPATGADEGRALLYDLGLALEEAGETPRALSVFLELMADAGEYRDVAGRADRLTRAQTGG